VVGFAIAAGLASRQTVARLLAVGTALYLIYIVSIGGDFMAGRFLSAPVVASVVILGWLATAPRQVWIGAAVILGCVGLTAQHIPALSDARFDDAGIRKNGIVNERGMFFKERSLVRGDRGTFRTPDWPVNTGAFIPPEVLPICGLAGITGIERGPYVHVLDECALTDPLLARMPAVFREDWRIGHFRRTVPEGYEDSLTGNANLLTDPGLKTFYDQIRLFTRSRHLLAADRLRAILAMNTGRDASLINVTYYRHERSIAALTSLSDIKEDGTPIDAPGVRAIGEQLGVTCEDRTGRRYFEVSLDADDSYRLTFLKGSLNLGWVDVGAVPTYRRPNGLAVHYGDVPPLAIRDGFDVVVVEPLSGNGAHAIGHLLIEGTPGTDATLRARRIRMHEHVEP
jgi:arabinofuranosyltransferase